MKIICANNSTQYKEKYYKPYLKTNVNENGIVNGNNTNHILDKPISLISRKPYLSNRYYTNFPSNQWDDIHFNGN